jgi:hypothetical protein
MSNAESIKEMADMAYALGTTHDPDRGQCEGARALLLRLARGLDTYATHLPQCPEDDRCVCGLRELMVDAGLIIAGFGEV